MNKKDNLVEHLRLNILEHAYTPEQAQELTHIAIEFLTRQLDNTDWQALMKFRNIQMEFKALHAHQEGLQEALRNRGLEVCYNCFEGFHPEEKHEARNQAELFTKSHYDRRTCLSCTEITIAEHTYTCDCCQQSCVAGYPSRRRWAKMCEDCQIKYPLEESRVRNNLSKSRKEGNPATLTLEEWFKAINHFGGLCAYCQEKPYEVLEHFIPGSKGGGTTAHNCVPACYSCNSRKKDKHPDDHGFPITRRRIAIVKEYLGIYEIENDEALV